MPEPDQSSPAMPTLNQVAQEPVVQSVEPVAPTDPGAPMTSAQQMEPGVVAAAAPTDAPDQMGPVTMAAAEAGDDMYTPEQIDELRANEVAFSWRASEYVHHHKSFGWYAVVVVVFIALIAVVAFLKIWLYIALFVIMAVALVVYARKPPRILSYELTHEGIKIDGQAHPYEEFRSFGVIADESWHTIDLEPVKRLSPRLAIIFDEADFEEIIGHLELHLPRVDRELDMIERFTRLIRF